MQLLEVKNETAKIIYNPEDNKLLPSDFLLIEDSSQKLAGQITSVYNTADSNNNTADVRLVLCIDKDNKLSYYNGYIPSKNAKIIYVTADDITEMIKDSESNIYLGGLTRHPKSVVKVPLSLVNNRLLIQCDREDNTKVILQNIVSELYMKHKKVVLLDFDGRYSRILNVPRLTVSESFKFPLNIDAFNHILEYETAGCSLEDKNVIQNIVLEMRDYLSETKDFFLPFTLFKNVIINEFSANPIPGLMHFRNKLWHYGQEGLFAEKQDDFNIINEILQDETMIIVDASKIECGWHKFALETAAKIINERCFFALAINDIPMDKRSIIQLYNNENIIPIIASSYDFKYRDVLKSFCKNQILFKPSKPLNASEQNEALMYKLNDDDFILYGEASLNLALIVKLRPFDVKTSEEIEAHEIRRDVDKILSAGAGGKKSILPKEASIEAAPAAETGTVQSTQEEQQNTADNDSNEITEDVILEEETPVSAESSFETDFTDEDLDFLDSLDDAGADEIFEEAAESIDNTDYKINEEKEEDELLDALSQIENESAPQKNENKTEDLQLKEENIENEDKIIQAEKKETDAASGQNADEAAEAAEAEPVIEFKEISSDESGEDEPLIEFKDTEEHEEQEDEPLIEFKDSIEYGGSEDDILSVKSVPEDDTDIESELDELASGFEDFEDNEPQMGSVADKTKSDIEYYGAEDDSNMEGMETVDDFVKMKKPAKKDKESKKAEEKGKLSSKRIKEEIIPLNSLIENIKSKHAAEKKQNKAQPEKLAAEEKKSAKQPAKNKGETKAVKNTLKKSSPVNSGKAKKKNLTVYEPETAIEEEKEQELPFKAGDRVYHPKHGAGVVEGFANYSNKILFCQVEFEKVGRRILDPRISGLKKID